MKNKKVLLFIAQGFEEYEAGALYTNPNAPITNI